MIIADRKTTAELRETLQRLKHRYAIKERKPTYTDSRRIVAIATDAVYCFFSDNCRNIELRITAFAVFEKGLYEELRWTSLVCSKYPKRYEGTGLVCDRHATDGWEPDLLLPDVVRVLKQKLRKPLKKTSFERDIERIKAGKRITATISNKTFRRRIVEQVIDVVICILPDEGDDDSSFLARKMLAVMKLELHLTVALKCKLKIDKRGRKEFTTVKLPSDDFPHPTFEPGRFVEEILELLAEKPAKEVLEALEMKSKEYTARKCSCGGPVEKRHKYCQKCARRIARQKHRDRARKYRRKKESE